MGESVIQPDRCPTCGSDKRLNYLSEWDGSVRRQKVEPPGCPDPWHDSPVPDRTDNPQPEESTMSADRKLSATADLLAEGYEPEDITIRPIAVHEVRRLVKRAVSFTLSAKNLERPGPDGKYAPEWYVAQDVGTHIIEGLGPVLGTLLTCESIGPDGKRCVGGLLHTQDHWDGEGHSWEAPDA